MATAHFHHFVEKFFWSHRFKRYGKGRFDAASPV
ncbi:MAG: hypothetical protein [Bacteroides phage LoVEphage]|nr:MAG: hypothetical protein [Bacteroides phage LoVEphage]